MLSKTDIRNTIASLFLALALVLGAAILAPVASAEEGPPPPPPGTEDLPAPPAEEAPSPEGPSGATDEGAPVEGPSDPVIEDRVTIDRTAPATGVLEARISGRKLVLTLSCTAGGKVKVGRASRGFKCRDGKGRAVLKLTRSQLRKSTSPRGLRTVASIRSGGKSVRAPIVADAARRRAATMSADMFGVRGFCVAHAGSRDLQVQIEANSRGTFGIAGVGEQVYWGSMLYIWESGSWHNVWHGWMSYNVTGTLGFPMTQAFDVNRGYWTMTKVWAWSKRYGYTSQWASFTYNGFGDVYSQGAYCKMN